MGATGNSESVATREETAGAHLHIRGNMQNKDTIPPAHQPKSKHQFQDHTIDGYSFAAPEDELGYTTHFKALSDGTIAEIDNYSNKIVRKQASDFEKSFVNPSAILPVPILHLHHRSMPYDEHIASHIIAAITEGHSITSICKNDKMPSAGTIGRWRVENPEFDEAVKKARAIRAECYHDKIVESTDEVYDWKEIPAAKLHFDKLKWLAAVNDPKTFAASKSEKSAVSAGQVIIDTGIRD